jgi:hypothetical protein
MFTLEAQEVVAAPLEPLFDFFADIRNEKHWNPDTREVELITAEPLGEGAVFTERVRGAGRLTVTLTHYDRPRRLDVVAESPRMVMGLRFAFAPAGDRTSLVARADVHCCGAMRLAEPLLRPAMARAFRRRHGQVAAGFAASRGTL